MRAKRHFKKGFGSTAMAVFVLLMGTTEVMAYIWDNCNSKGQCCICRNTGRSGVCDTGCRWSPIGEYHCDEMYCHCDNPGSCKPDYDLSANRHTINVKNLSGEKWRVTMNVQLASPPCVTYTNNVYKTGCSCQVEGVLLPGETKSCSAHGLPSDQKNQAFIHLVAYLADTNYKVFDIKFDQAAGDHVELYMGPNGKATLDCGNIHYSAYVFKFELNPAEWVVQPPTNTIRDARGQLACAARDLPGIGRAFQDNNKTWYCQFGQGGQQREIRWLVGDQPGQFYFLNINPAVVEWKPGTTTRAVRSITPTNPVVCRTNPGGGWPHQEFGWVYQDRCVLGWGGQSPAFPQYETLNYR